VQFGYRARTVAGQLAQKELVRFIERDGQRFAELTANAKRVLDINAAKAALAVPRQKRWDKRWRMVMFDIPERRTRVHEQLRGMMREMGFLHIEDSVWVFPYDCEGRVGLLKAELHVGKDVLYAVIEHIENDNHIRAHFGFPLARM
jgi:DNA-binding transcriptional regulator PaaX